MQGDILPKIQAPNLREPSSTASSALLSDARPHVLQRPRAYSVIKNGHPNRIRVERTPGALAQFGSPQRNNSVALQIADDRVWYSGRCLNAIVEFQVEDLGIRSFEYNH